METVKLMKQHLLLPIALALLVAACATGCGREPTANVPTDGPSAAPVQTEESEGIGQTTPAATAVPTIAPQKEEAGMTPTPVRKATEVELQEGTERVVQLAREDLARRLGLPPESIRLVSIHAVQWPDASLGCPRPNVKYVQVITPGFKVVLEAEGRTYEYHTGGGRRVSCDQEGHLTSALPSQTVTVLTVGGTPTIARGEVIATPVSGHLERLIGIAKQDLARRLEITPEEVEVVHIEKAEWLDTSLGCAEPGLSRLPVAVPGYRVILSARGWEYVYHTGKESGVVYCPKG
jgi:hypothetical protein